MFLKFLKSSKERLAANMSLNSDTVSSRTGSHTADVTALNGTFSNLNCKPTKKTSLVNDVLLGFVSNLLL